MVRVEVQVGVAELLEQLVLLLLVLPVFSFFWILFMFILFVFLMVVLALLVLIQIRRIAVQFIIKLRRCQEILVNLFSSLGSAAIVAHIPVNYNYYHKEQN